MILEAITQLWVFQKLWNRKLKWILLHIKKKTGKNKLIKKYVFCKFDLLYKQIVKNVKLIILYAFPAQLGVFSLEWLWSYILRSLEAILVILYVLEDLSLISTFCFLLRKKVKYTRHCRESYKATVTEICPGASVLALRWWECFLFHVHCDDWLSPHVVGLGWMGWTG